MIRNREFTTIYGWLFQGTKLLVRIRELQIIEAHCFTVRQNALEFEFKLHSSQVNGINGGLSVNGLGK